MTLFADIPGERLDSFLARSVEGLSRSAAQKLIEDGLVTRNGKPGKKNDKLNVGDTISYEIPEPKAVDIAPKEIPLDIVYEDEDLLLINKPAGVAMHPAALTEEPVTVAGAVAHYLRTDCFHAVNRLDRGTTGVMAAAKTGYIHALCMAQLHTDAFQRDYRAVCEGVPVPGEGDIDLPLGRAEGSLLKRCPDPQGLPAHTHYEVLAAANGRALLRLTPTTGRTHQLRVHLAAIGHPLTGDWLYGTEDRALIARPALHSYHLVMRHPLTGSSIDVTAPLPEDMQALLR